MKRIQEVSSFILQSIHPISPHLSPIPVMNKPSGGRKQLIDPSNEVHKLMIFKGYLKWNKKYEKVSDRFRVNPAKLGEIAMKPNQTDPRLHGSQKYVPTVYRGPVEEAFSNDRLRRTISQRLMTPGEKYRGPLTSSQEVGWYHTDVVPRPKSSSNMHYRVRGTCYETFFATEYLRHAKVNPFKVRNRI